MMDKYSKLLLHFSSLNGNNNEQEPYPNFTKDLAILESPSEELCSIIKEDLPTILPAVLILSLHSDVSVRMAIGKTFDTFSNIMQKHPSVKNESWWREMEDKLIAQQYSSKLSKMVENNDEPWTSNWVFVANLIVVNSEHVHSTGINSLLKVLELAFRMCKKNDQFMEKAYFCWNQLIDAFSRHPRVSASQKLVELFVRPLSTTHLSAKCPELKMQTWCNLMRKIGFSSSKQCTVIIEPFIDNMYHKEDDSLCRKFPLECLKALDEVVHQKKYYKHFAQKLLSAIPACYQTINNGEMEVIFLGIWKKIIERIPEVHKENKNEYIVEFFSVFHQLSQMEKIEFNLKVNDILVEKKIFNLENLRICMESKLILVPIISVFIQNDNFRNASFSTVVKELLDNYTDSNNKQQQNNDLQIWDLLCESYTTWIRSYESPQNVLISDIDSLSSLLMAPIVWKQWSVVAVQRTWFSLVDAVQTTSSSTSFLPVLSEKLKTAMNSSLIPINVCIEICTHISDGNKLAFNDIMPVLRAASGHVSPKEPKPLMDLMVLLENAISHVPKAELTTFVNELMADATKYEYPWGIRIKTKCTKVLRKLLMLKDTSTAEEPEDKPQAPPDNEQGSGSKVRSPIIAQSNFLHRLAKAEEKKKKKVPTHASVFGERSPKGSGEVKAKEESSPVVKLPVAAVTKEVPSSGRLSPAIPSTVTIVTPTRVTRSRSKSPDPAPLRQSLPASIKTFTRRSPTYFDETAQEEFVVVPPKPKTTPLTEHQKEMLSKRKSYIPALYEDLTQDTQSQSQSLKEIDVLKYIKNSGNEAVSNEVKTEVGGQVEALSKPMGNTETMSLNDGENNETSAVHNESSKIKQDEEKSSEKSETSTNDSKCYSVDMFSSEPLKLNSDNEKGSEKESCSEESPKSVKKDECLLKVGSTPQSTEQIEALNETPTKQPGPPTPRNLMMKMNMIKEIEEEEEEREKENKFTNAKQNDSLAKRRSARKSISKFSSKIPDESRDEKAKKPVEIPKIILNPPENTKTEIDNHCEKNDVAENKEVTKTPKDLVDVLESNEVVLEKETSDVDMLSNENKSAAEESVNVNSNDPHTKINERNDAESLNPSEASHQSSESVEEEESLDDTEKIENEMEISEAHESDTVKTRTDGIVLSEENSESPSGIVNSWAMTSASKTKPRKKRNSENLQQFSPKLLRSKRLSLTKKTTCDKMDETPTKKMKVLKGEGESVSKPEEVVENINCSSEPEQAINGIDEGDNSTEKKQCFDFKIDVTPNRKRRSLNVDNEVEEKKKRSDEPLSQDSLLMVKNNFVGKPRKKKVIKANVKSSPNNLEQWLIRAGRTVVIKDVLSQESSNSESETSKIIEESPDIQINVSESKNIVVEKIDISNGPIEISSSPEKGEDSPLPSEPDVSPVGSQEEEENLHNVTVVVTDCSPTGEDELEQVKCQEGELPSTPEMDAETLRRRRWRTFKKEDTPVREIPTRPQRRTAQMVKMATSEDDPYVRTPIKKRASIKPFKKTDNWPEGSIEPWVPCVPTPPGVSPSLSILKKRQNVATPPTTPPSSPQVKKKRVSFLDPVVISGLMYAKNCWESKGEVQYADIPPGEKPVWVAENDNEEPRPSSESDHVAESSESKTDALESTEAIEVFKDIQECELVQNFLNSTPDAPWSHKIPIELDLTAVDEELASCTESPAELLAIMCADLKERALAEEELKKYGVLSVADLKSVSLTQLANFCDQFLKAKSLSGIIEEYLKEKKTRSTKSDSPKKADSPVEPEELKTEEAAMEVDKVDEHLVSAPQPSSHESNPSEENMVAGDKDSKEAPISNTTQSENCVPVDRTDDSIDTSPTQKSSEPIQNGIEPPQNGINKQLKVSDVVEHIPNLLEHPDFRNALAGCVLDLPGKELESFVKLILQGLPKKTGADNCLSLAIDLIQNTKNELRYNPD